MIEITQYAKYGGPLTKKIALGSDGTVHSDSSDCMMQKGEARRLLLADIAALAGAIEAFQPKHALSLGRLRPGLPDLVRVAAKAKLNGVERPGLIARTAGNIVFVGGKPALALLDHDCKGMPGEIAEQLREMGGFEAALSAVMPKLAESARLFRASTSAGLYRVDSGEPVPGSNGLHGYVVLADGADVERFLGALHQRCWLAGLGWHMVGSAGQLLERSIVDRIVGTPERLVFEGPPVLGPGLAQDLAARRPIISDGGMLDSAAAMPPLSIVELARLAERQAKAAAALQGEAAQARERFVSAQAERLAKHTGSTLASARRVIEQQCRGVLLPDIELPFDAPELAGKTVADVLTEPDKYIDETLADPLEGVGYGRNKAVVIRRPDGSLFIHSFAHGRTVYDLKIDGGMARAMLERAAADEVLRKFIRLMLTADLDPIEAEQLRQLTAKRAGIGVRQIDAALKAARAAHSREQAAEAKRTRLAERRDPRPQIPAPAEDAETLPHTEALNEILKTVRDPEPPMRDVTGALTRVWVRMVPSIHGLGAREDEAPPEMPLLTQLDLYGAEEQIERHVEHAVETKSGPRTVRLGDRFVRHYMRRDDRALPVVTSVATLPIVLPDRSILAAPGLHRDRGVVIRIPENLRAIAQINDRSDMAAKEAIKFLANDWLGDVATEDARGKAVLVACACTIIERALLAERPAFWVTAGKRSSGKTTALNMISQALLGTRAPAAAWSPVEEERRKALFAYLLEGLPFLVWDNIEKGTLISSPAIEKALTAESMSDRVLGESRTGAPNATTIMAFTGNNIAPKGDLASRGLEVRLVADRPDPENRDFKHPDPIGWTRENRVKILQALYTVMLAESVPREAASPTRFKPWFGLVGAPVEHAMRLIEQPVSFKTMFEAIEQDDEENTGTADALTVIRKEWSYGVEARGVAEWINNGMLLPASGSAEGLDGHHEMAVKLKTALEQVSGKQMPEVSATIVTWRLKAMVDAPVKVGEEVLVLRRKQPSGAKDLFNVVVIEKEVPF